MFFGIKIDEGYPTVEIDNKDISQQGLVISTDGIHRYFVLGNAHVLLN